MRLGDLLFNIILLILLKVLYDFTWSFKILLN